MMSYCNKSIVEVLTGQLVIICDEPLKCLKLLKFVVVEKWNANEILFNEKLLWCEPVNQSN